MRFGRRILLSLVASYITLSFNAEAADQEGSLTSAISIGQRNAEIEISLDHGLIQGDRLNDGFYVYRLRMAAESGSVESQTALGRLYRDGELVDLNPELATTWFYQAAESGDAEAQYLHGDLIDQRDAFQWYLLAAEQGHAKAQYRVALTLDYPEALPWYRLAAEQGLPEAQYNLAVMYELGQGLMADQGVANSWYLRAAEAGFELAQYRLGVNYGEGRGFDRDIVIAHAWYSLVAEYGDLLNEDAEMRKRALKLSPKQVEQSRLAYEDFRLSMLSNNM